ncbi:MAG: NAD(P)H-hydrate dehydratase [Armatimonadota bacterium]
MRIVSAEEMKEIDRRTAAEHGIPSIQLMERAGRALADAAGSAEAVVVFAGPGNNGGDGLTAARLLIEEGKDVHVFLAAEPESLKGDAREQYHLLSQKSDQIHHPGSPAFRHAEQAAGEADVVLDALLGTGARGEPEGAILHLVQAAGGAAHIIAADIPTGVDCDTGIAPGAHVMADETVVFGLPKRFLFQNDGLEASGAWQIADIGHPDELLEEFGDAAVLTLLDALPGLPLRGKRDNKRTSGVVLVVAGSTNYPGALALTCRGALRAGAGLVFAASTSEGLAGVRAQLPECPLLPLPDEHGMVNESAADLVAERAAEADVLVIGPGLGRSEGVRRFLNRLFELAHQLPTGGDAGGASGEGALRRYVLDADALFHLPSLKHRPPGVAVLTPHEGEAGRLLGVDYAKVSQDRFGAVREVASRYDAVCLLKGAYSLIAAPGSDVMVNTTGNPLLASGGTGDVLSGIVGTLFAVRGSAFLAACAGAMWHGQAADDIYEEESVGIGWTASEVADALPSTLARLRERLFEVIMRGENDGEDDDVWDEGDYQSLS